MKRNAVVVDGITLTRAQVEQAVRELEKPTYVPRPGHFFRTSSSARQLWLCLAKDEYEAAFRKKYPTFDYSYYIVLAASTSDGRLNAFSGTADFTQCDEDGL